MQQQLFNHKQLPKRKKAAPKTYGPNDVLLFGKYMRKTIKQIVSTDPQYLEYMIAKYRLSVTQEVNALLTHYKFLAI